jgi:hypothetical protein
VIRKDKKKSFAFEEGFEDLRGIASLEDGAAGAETGRTAGLPGGASVLPLLEPCVRTAEADHTGAAPEERLPHRT